MRKFWFKKLLMSYLPIFLAITLFMILMFLYATIQYAKKEGVRANRVFAEQIMQSVDYSLRAIDQTMLNELSMKDDWEPFFASRPGLNKYIVEYELSKKLNGIAGAYPQIESIYAVRLSDQTVLSNKARMGLDSMPDRDFIREAAARPEGSRFWTSRRELPDANNVSVISLVLRYPLLSGENGMVIVNMNTNAIREQLIGKNESVMSFARLYDKEGSLIAGSDIPASLASAVKGIDEQDVLSVVASAYNGWEIRSGLLESVYSEIYSSLTLIWISLIVLAAAIGIGFIVYVTARNYKPIESILQRIVKHAPSKSPLQPHGTKQDEFAFIASAFEELIERTNEHSAYKRRHLFYELYEGNRSINPADWAEDADAVGLNNGYAWLHTAILDIDKYAKHCEAFNDRDRALLRFAVANVYTELAQQQGVTVWPEWVSNQKMGVMFQSAEEDPIETEARIRQICDKMIDWVQNNLPLTVTIALGTGVEHLADVSHSFHSAAEGLRYKSVLGQCRVIAPIDLYAKQSGDVYNQLQTIRAMARSFRLGDGQWKNLLEQVKEQLYDELFSRDDITNLLNYVQYQLTREMSELSDDMRNVWNNDAVPQLNAMIESFETLDDLFDWMITLLNEIDGKLSRLRDKRSNHAVIASVRTFIEQQYANPDMSLTYIAEHFHIKASYISRLFKEETGENFVDYLARIRIEKAMELLKETDTPVQDIAVQVGYTHYVSFNRVFKKIAGLTAGDYRK